MIDANFKTHHMTALLWVFFLAILYPGGAVANNTNIERLNAKSAEIEQMKETVQTRYRQTLDIREQLGEMLGNFEEEIRHELTQRKISGFTKAMGVSRIHYNLELIRKLRAYMVLLDKKIIYFQEGRQKLDFFTRQVQDDMMILNTVNHMAIDALIDRIEQALNQYASAVGDDLMDAGAIAPEDLEIAWKRVVNR